MSQFLFMIANTVAPLQTFFLFAVQYSYHEILKLEPQDTSSTNTTDLIAGIVVVSLVIYVVVAVAMVGYWL